MPIFEKLTRKLQTALTTDAKPDPPRIILEGPDPNSNLSTAEIKQKSAPVTPDPQRIENVSPVISRQRSATDQPAQNSEFSGAENLGYSKPTKPQSRPRSPRAKANKSKSKTGTNVNIMKFDIANSQDLNIIMQQNNFYSDGYTKSEQGVRKPKDEPMPNYVEALSSSEKVISKDDMLLVKTYIGSGWRDVARRLRYSESQIEQFEEDYKRVNEVVYQILTDWKQANTKDAQVGELISAMWSSQEYDCAKRLAASHTTSA